MKRIFWLVALLLSLVCPALAQDVGYYSGFDCTGLTPVVNSTICTSSTTGAIGVWDGTAWRNLQPIPSYTVAAGANRLPATCTDGQLANVTDNIRGVWKCFANKWVSITGHANVKDFGAIGDDATNDTVAIQTAITDTPTGGVVYFPGGVYRVAGLTGGDFLTFLGSAGRNDSNTRGAVLKSATRIFDVTDLNSTVFRNMGFSGTAVGVGVAFGSSGVNASLGLDGVLFEENTFYYMDYAIDMPMIYTRIIGNQFRGTPIRVPGGAGAANNHNLFERNVWGADTGKASILEIGIAAGGSQPQGGQALQNVIRGNGFEGNASGRAILLNGAMTTVIDENWFEANGGTEHIAAVVSGGINNTLFVRRNRFGPSAASIVQFIAHGNGAVAEFSGNHGNGGANCVAISNGVVYQAFANYQFNAALQLTYPAASIVVSGISTGSLTTTSGGLHSDGPLLVDSGALIVDATGMTVNSKLRIDNFTPVAVSVTATIFTSAQAGGADTANLTLVQGTKSGNGGIQFSDLVLWFTNGGAPSVIASQVRGAPAARTYTVNALDLQLAMAANTYPVNVVNLHGGN